MTFKSLGRSVSAAAAFLLIAAVGFSQVPASKHVVLVIDENSSYDDVMDNMPWLTSQGSANGYASNYLSDNGGSLLDYLWLASGSCHSSANCKLPKGTHDFRCNGNDCYYKNTTTSDPITDDNIFRELNNSGISWKVYAQSYSLAGGTVTTPDNNNGTSYYRRHNGATWYSDILSNVDKSANNIVDLDQLTTDLNDGKLPAFVIIVPDGNHDAHDCPVGMSSCTEEQKLSAADGFLSSTLEPILATSDFQRGGDGLVIVTFDECADGTNGGCGASVYTALIGPNVIPHFVSKVRYKHENTLRTMLKALGSKGFPGASSTAAAMSDFFITTSDKPQVDVTNPANGASVGSSVTVDASVVPSSGHSTTGWDIYVDSVSAYTAGAKDTISPTLSLKDGDHTVVVRAWDSSGAYGDQTLSLSVNASKASVTVTSPKTNTTVVSPVNIVASAVPTPGYKTSGWWIYVDGSGVSSAGSTSSINKDVSMSSGIHTVIVRAWDTSGAYASQTLTLTVGSQTAVTVSTPNDGSSMKSPITVKASATASSGQSITGWHVYLDGKDKYTGGGVTSIDTSLKSVSSGTHTILVRAWDSSGAYSDQSVDVTVQ